MIDISKYKDPDDRFSKLEKLGEGTYGVVYKVKDKLTNEVISSRFLPSRRLDLKMEMMVSLQLQ